VNTKSEKELAFLRDLYIATDWGERFAELVDQHVELPSEGRALYVAAGTGEHALALQKRAGEKVQFVGVDESDECLELARAKAAVVNQKLEFRREESGALSFCDGEFDLVLGDVSMLPPPQVAEIISELVRVTAPGATVAWWLPTCSSFGEFFSIYWEALQSAGLDSYSAHAEALITELPTITQVEAIAKKAGLENVESWTTKEEFDYESGEQFLSSPLIADFLLKKWMRSLSETDQPQVSKEIARIIDEERHDSEFALSMKATLVVGKKGRAN